MVTKHHNRLQAVRQHGEDTLPDGLKVYLDLHLTHALYAIMNISIADFFIDLLLCPKGTTYPVRRLLGIMFPVTSQL